MANGIQVSADSLPSQDLRARIAELEEQVANYQQIERALIAARGRWHAVVENAAETVLLLDRDGMILSLHVDRARGKESGESNFDGDNEREVVGSISYDYIEPAHRERMRHAIEKVFQTGEPAYYEVKQAGLERWYGCRAAPLLRDGRVDSVAAICTDITERIVQEEALRQSEERLRLMVEQIPAILWATDREMRFTLSMGAALGTLGLEKNEVVGRTAWDYFQTSDPSFPAIAGIRAALGGTPARFEQFWQERTFETYVQPLRDGCREIVGIIGVALDVTEQKAAENSLRQAHDLLEHRVAERTRELSEANELLQAEKRRLKRLLELHDRDRQLIAYEIHDGMVQDMTGATMFLEAAQAAFPEPAGDRKESSAKRNLGKAIRLMREGIGEARRLINGLRPPVLESQGLVAALENLAEENRLNGDLEVALDCRVGFHRIAPALETAIYRIVQEGLNNVRKHSEAKRAEVGVVQDGDRLTIRVADAGVGFDPAKVAGGTHGLDGIRERTRLLDGRFAIESQPGKGAVLTVSLPLADVLLPNEETP